MADEQPFEGTDNGIDQFRRRPFAFTHGTFYNMRDQVFHALFYRLAVVYSRSVSHALRRTLEFIMLFEAIFALVLLTYVHFAFNRNPGNCLADIANDWPNDGILRVEVLMNNSLLSEYTLDDSYRKESVMYGTETESEHLEMPAAATPNSTGAASTDGIGQWELEETSWSDWLLNWIVSFDTNFTSDNGTFSKISVALDHLFSTDTDVNHSEEDVYIYEYAVEFGFLRMSPKTRQKLNIPTTFVVLDSKKEHCFGNALGKALLSEFLGYDDILLYSLKHVASEHPNRGFCRNVATGDFYKFVNMSVSRFSYIPAAFLLILFTTSISMLLRYSHQQIFIFMVDVLHVLDRTVLVMFPFAPLLTAILALIGVETLISELFNEASTGFYVILMVWLADQYNIVCCHTNISRRHWIRFFYLYHFIFYAYHYRFNGHFSFMALMTSWLFIQHSMIYFFHHYELPAIEHQTRVHSLLARVNHQTPVRGLVTVISQMSPNEISHFTLDTRAEEQAQSTGASEANIVSDELPHPQTPILNDQTSAEPVSSSGCLAPQEQSVSSSPEAVDTSLHQCASTEAQEQSVSSSPEAVDTSLHQCASTEAHCSSRAVFDSPDNDLSDELCMQTMSDAPVKLDAGTIVVDAKMSDSCHVETVSGDLTPQNSDLASCTGEESFHYQ